MYVIKRDGRKESVKFDKITARVKKLCYGLNPIVDPTAVAMKVIEGLYEGVTTEKLDNLNFKDDINFFKIDAQGYESIIIENGLDKISKALVVQLELSPVPIYKGEKNFIYVSNLMEKLNFNLNMFFNINKQIFKPMIINNNPGIGLIKVKLVSMLLLPSDVVIVIGVDPL